jgi:nicotinate-nucleotide adenylyltransferase
MGADILPELHRWHRWRAFARSLPIAVLTRPRYMGPAMLSPAMTWAMTWARRWRRGPERVRDWTEWPLPAITVLQIRPTALSATAIRAADPDWGKRLKRA